MSKELEAIKALGALEYLILSLPDSNTKTRMSIRLHTITEYLMGGCKCQ
jgi:hypothetical protein